MTEDTTTDTTCHMSISLDGFVAGPDQSLDHPLGVRGGELHTWHMPGVEVGEADRTAASWLMRPRGAYVMGRNMFGPVRGTWDEPWEGWWGPEPPYHAPVFVLTHHEHEPIEMAGGTRRSTSSPRGSTPPTPAPSRSLTGGASTSPGERRPSGRRSPRTWSTS